MYVVLFTCIHENAGTSHQGYINNIYLPSTINQQMYKVYVGLYVRTSIPKDKLLDALSDRFCWYVLNQTPDISTNLYISISCGLDD